MEIKPGLGLGAIRFGFDERLVTRLLGEPAQVGEAEYVKGSGDWHRELSYPRLAASFRFDLEDDFKLGNITINGAGHTLHGRDLHGMPRAGVARFLGVSAHEVPYLESADREIDFECLSYDRMGIMMFFHADCLQEIQFGYLFESDGETAIWPSADNQNAG